jgi:23S rRNA (uracil1939-C5)-methyltransferase
MPIANIESLEHEGRGIARADGKTIFIEGALPGEIVDYSSYRKKPNYELANANAILKPSCQRVMSRCAYFGKCGGCSMQHLESTAQVAAKQRVMEDALWHLARLRPETVFQPLQGESWGYRHRARLSVRHVAKKGGVLVGFHERRSSYVAVMDDCQVLPQRVAALIPELKKLINSLSIRDRLPQIEVSIGEDQVALVLRILESTSVQDEISLRAFAEQHSVVVYLQPGGPDTVERFHPLEAPVLAYSLPDFDITLQFSPTEFTQVNHGVNRMLVRRAMKLLDPQPGERVVDMFCGLGNFTLPIARSGASVLGIEGSPGLVSRAKSNAERNGLQESCEFLVANLFAATRESVSALGRFDKMLVDPPREGAIALVSSLDVDGPSRIVYVSCNPATLARDAAVLVHEQGYLLRGAGIANMFPQTSHVESIALFERE